MIIYRFASERTDTIFLDTKKELGFFLQLSSAKKALITKVIDHNKLVNDPEWIDDFGGNMLEYYFKTSDVQYETSCHRYFIEEVEVQE